jgi:transposase
MLNQAIPLETLGVPVLINYIKELETTYNQRIKELETSLKNVQNDYLILKETYDLLVYKRFARSAEQLIADKQPSLFTPEETNRQAPDTTDQETFEEIKSFTRRKKGRKAIDPQIPREERTIDIAESEKICACGAKMTRIGEETSEKLHIEPPRIYVEKTVRPKYACLSCEGTEDEAGKTVRVAPVEPAIIP